MALTLTISGQIILAMGANASDAQISGANVETWGLFAESDMEKASGGVGLVANYAKITPAYKQWLAAVASHRAAFYGINQGQNTWQLATSQSKLNVIDSIWQDYLKDIKDKDIIDAMGL